MIINNLYSEVLLQPISEGANNLYIVSGYASATFARRHIKELIEKSGDREFKINLIIGMPKSKIDHGAYIQLHDEFGDIFKGYYLDTPPPVHTKVFSWFSDETPVVGYSGSANYSQYGFFKEKQFNQMVVDSPDEIRSFYDELLNNCVYIPEAKVSDSVILRPPKIVGSVPAGEVEWIEAGKSVRISLLDGKTGKTPLRSGINWGQRPDREKNQAYLSIKKDARDEGFLPEKGFTFTLLTDDSVTMDCVVAQDGRKSVQTTRNNSELGKYFRERLGVESGGFVTTEMLEQYGRTDFTLIKIDDENFQLDFSV